MIPTLSASWPSHLIARAIFCRFNSETVITCAESSPRTLSVTLMTAKVIRRASPTRPSSPFFGNPIDAGRRLASGGRASSTGPQGVKAGEMLAEQPTLGAPPAAGRLDSENSGLPQGLASTLRQVGGSED